MRLLQAVEALARHAAEDSDRDEEDDHRGGSRVSSSGHRGRSHLTERRVALLPGPAREAVFLHEHDAGEAARDRERAAEHDARAQRCDADRDLEEESHDRAGLAEAGGAEEDLAGSLGTAFVRDPRLFCAARERVRDPPQRPECDHEPRRGDEPDRDRRGSHPEVADDERQAPAVRVRDDAGRDLEEEDRALHRCPHEHELERGEVQRPDEIHGHHDPRRHPQREGQSVVERLRRRATSGPG